MDKNNQNNQNNQIRQVKTETTTGFLSRLRKRVSYFRNPEQVDERMDHKIEELTKELGIFSKGGINNQVLYSPHLSREGFGQEGIAYTDSRHFFDYLYDYAMRHPTLCVILNALSGEIFREGLITEPLFVVKCAGCGSTYEHEIEECESCKSTNLVSPDPKMRERIEQELINVSQAINDNGQTIIDVSKEFEMDLDTLDVCYGLIRYEYGRIGDKIKLDEGKPERTFKSFWRVHPGQIRPIVNKEGIVGQKDYTCVNHRLETFAKGELCRKCGSVTFPVTHARFKPQSEEVVAYYIKGEVVQTSKFYPSPIGGMSPVKMLYLPLELIKKQTEHLVSFYDLNRIPEGIIWAKTRNLKSLAEFWDAQQEQKKKNRHHIPLLGVDPDGSGQAIGFLALDNTPREMEFIPTRDEATHIIAAFYGVSLIFLNDASTGGGLNNEGLQITVINRSVSSSQSIHNNKIYPFLLEAMGITDYRLILAPSEEQDEKAELEREILKNQIAQGWKQLGYEVERDDKGEWIIGEKVKVEEASDPFAEAFFDPERELKDSKTDASTKPSSSPAKPENKVSV